MCSTQRPRLLVVLLAAIASSAGVVHAAEPSETAEPNASAGSSASAAPSAMAEASAPVRRGPFNVRRFALRDLSIDELSWTGEPPPPLPPLRKTDDAGVPMFRWVDGDHYYR